jgi:hypothetical protein
MEKNMSGDVEFGYCEICGKEDALQRKYYHYNIKCDCCSPQHSELVRYCKNCEPREPLRTKLSVKTDIIKDSLKLF